jgi:hypothetical protein
MVTPAMPQSLFDEQFVMFAGTQSAESVVPVPLQAPEGHWPAAFTHCPLGHWLSAVQRHTSLEVLHCPTAHEYGVVVVQLAGGTADGSWQWKSLGTAEVLPLHAPVAQPLQGMQSPAVPHCESLVHQQTSPLVVTLQKPAVHEETDVVVGADGMPGLASTQW